MNKYIVLYQEMSGDKRYRKVEVEASNPQAALHLAVSPAYHDNIESGCKAIVVRIADKTEWELSSSWSRI